MNLLLLLSLKNGCIYATNALIKKEERFQEFVAFVSMIIAFVSMIVPND